MDILVQFFIHLSYVSFALQIELESKFEEYQRKAQGDFQVAIGLYQQDIMMGLQAVEMEVQQKYGLSQVSILDHHGKLRY